MYGERSREAVRFKECSEVYYKIYIGNNIIYVYRTDGHVAGPSRRAVPTGMEATRTHSIYIHVLDTYIIITTIYDIYI